MIKVVTSNRSQAAAFASSCFSSFIARNSILSSRAAELFVIARPSPLWLCTHHIRTVIRGQVVAVEWSYSGGAGNSGPASHGCGKLEAEVMRHRGSRAGAKESREPVLAGPPWSLPYRFSLALAAVAGPAAGVGAFHPDIFRDPAMTVGNAQGTDLVILLVAIPMLLVSMLLAARGS